MENEEKIYKFLDFTNYSNINIVDMLEISNFIKLTENYYTNIHEKANDGILTFGAFIKFCYDKFILSKYCDMYNFINIELNYLISDFEKEFFNK